MAWGRRQQYCCVNVAGQCPHALGDALFTESQFQAWGGNCAGSVDHPGCGQPLQPGLKDDRRLRWALSGIAAISLTTSATLAVQAVFFPAPISDVAFVAAQSRVEDSVGSIVVQIRRTSGQSTRSQVRASFIDGTAKAGVDYQVPAQTFVLNPGETEARIAVPLLPDTTLTRGERHFSLVLDNVLGQPRHTVVIAPKAPDTTATVQIEQLVLTASRIAADIAGFVVKQETMERLLSEFRGRDSEFLEFRQQMRDAGENLVRARESYLQAVRGLQTQPPQQVFATIERMQGELKRKEFHQQARVLPVVRDQFRELMNGKSAEMDRWVNELGKTIDRIPARNLGAQSL